ncbi:MAG TPA: Trm112 family protein [Planctomycetota bacterium]|nr:Trm112 family protein [Planctomycetota bacterium]
MTEHVPAGTEGTGGVGKGPIPDDLLEILVCPLGKAPLRLEGQSLICTKCGLTYMIEDGIPNMLIEEAKLPAGVTDIAALACYTEAK